MYERNGSMIGSASTQVTEAPQIPPVFHAVEKLERNANGLLDVMARLEQRLQPIAPPMPENAPNKGEKLQRGTLAGGIETQAEKVATACARLESLLSRLEI